LRRWCGICLHLQHGPARDLERVGVGRLGIRRAGERSVNPRILLVPVPLEACCTCNGVLVLLSSQSRRLLTFVRSAVFCTTKLPHLLLLLLLCKGDVMLGVVKVAWFAWLQARECRSGAVYLLSSIFCTIFKRR
jgi:hypothetical protein